MNFIVAVDENWNIGKDNDLLIKIPEDMSRFREITLGKAVVMGRKTLESFPGGKPLKNRKNIVITRNPDFKCENADIFYSVEEFLSNKSDYTEDIYVIGGGTIYNQLMNYCKYAYITKIYTVFDADTKINSLDDSPNWEIIERSELKEWNGIRFQYLTYENADIY